MVWQFGMDSGGQDLQDKLFLCPDNFPLGKTCIFREQEYSSHKHLETDLFFLLFFFFTLKVKAFDVY